MGPTGGSRAGEANPALAAMAAIQPSPSVGLVAVSPVAVQPSLPPVAAPRPSAAPVGQAAATPAGSVEHGQVVFSTVGCWERHGYAADGDVGPKLGPNPLPYGAFAAPVRTPRQDMPHSTPDQLSEQDLADIYAFIQSIPPPPTSSPPLTGQ